MEGKENGLGAFPSPVDIRDYKRKKIEQEYPKAYFIKGIPIKNQGSAPTCVAHALSELVEFHTLKDTNEFVKFSTEFIYGCRDSSLYEAEGMFIREGLQILNTYGDVVYSDLKGNSPKGTVANLHVQDKFDYLKDRAYPYRISAYYKIKTLDEIKQAIYNDGPVVASLKWQRKNFKKGFYSYNSNEPHGNHAILIVGWNENYLIGQNSWGATWGAKGFFFVPINEISEVFNEFYGVTDNIENVIKPSKIVKKVGPLANKLIQKTKEKNNA